MERTHRGMKRPARRRRTASPLDVAILAYPGLLPFEFGSALELLRRTRPAGVARWYRTRVVATQGRTVPGAEGLRVRADAGLDTLSQSGTIVVPGWRSPAERPPRPLLRALLDARERGCRFVSICTGAFVLASAGLLDGRRATTHWLYLDRMRREFPRVRVEADALYVDEGDVITSAGNAAGLDACLHLIRRDFGARAAAQVAHRVVLGPPRSGTQRQRVAAPVRERADRSLAPLLDWVRSHVHEPLDAAMLARRAAMSPRTLRRRFQEETGMSVRGWIAQARADHARELLEHPTLGIDDVAAQSGLGSARALRGLFARLGLAPPASHRPASGFRGRGRR